MRIQVADKDTSCMSMKDKDTIDTSSMSMKTECIVSDGGKESAWFKIKTCVKQGCNLSGLLFLLVIDWIMKQVQENGRNGLRWKINNKLDDLDFAADIALVTSSFQQMDDKTKKLATYGSRTGLKINAKKTKLNS